MDRIKTARIWYTAAAFALAGSALDSLTGWQIAAAAAAIAAPWLIFRS